MGPNITITILLTTFVPLIMIKCPITSSMIISTTFTMLYTQVPVTALVQRMSEQLNSFSLSAIPFFILMEEIIVAGGISNRLLAFANVCAGQITGGLVRVNILVSMLFGGIFGSAIANVSSLGVLEMPMMGEAGYEKDLSIAVTVASSCRELTVPSSRNMVLYSMMAGGVSMESLFCTGYIPGIMLGVFIMITCCIVSKKKYYLKGKKLPSKEALRVAKDTFSAIFAMVIIIDSVSAGFFTATESAAVSCIYCSLVGFFIYRELHLKDIPVVLGNTIKTLSMVYTLVAVADAFRWVMVCLNVPTPVTNPLLGISDNKIVILLLTNLALLLLGCVTGLAPLVLIMAPILSPVVTKFEMSPIQLGVVVMLSLGIRLYTPPVGTALFTGCAIGNMEIEKVSKTTLPLHIPVFIILLLVTFIPALTMALPELTMK